MTRSAETMTTIVPPKRRRAGAKDQAPVLAITLLAHPDPIVVGARALLPELGSGKEVQLSRLAPTLVVPGHSSTVLIGDPNVSRKPVVLRARDDGIEIDASGTSTEVQVNGRAVKGSAWLPGRTVEAGLVLELSRRVAALVHWHQDADQAPEHDMVGESSAVAALRVEITRVADSQVPVLVLGETGTGKEKVAHALHRASKRAAGPFVAVNMATLPTSMAASQLFGHVRGAFSGADRDSQGFFQQASGGTLFLDEIGETPADVQPMLLRALEESTIQPLGAANPLKVDVRVVAATDLDLEQAVSRGEFRAPLVHRLAGYQIATPPLRDRRDDIGRLLYHFLREEILALGESNRLLPEDPGASLWLPTELVRRLVRYDWPGNVRELRNVARRLAILGRNREVIAFDAGLDKTLGAEPAPEAQPEPPRSAGEITDDELATVMARNQYKTSKTARELGISKATLYQLIAQNPSIRTAKELSAEEISEWRDKTGGNTTEMAAGLKVSERGLKLRMTDLGL
ncbi:MAG: sigma-54 dependent transcriptional regulator [Deltaproteobacteria bacterium]|nr:sigma-54 dependent transcriptional regulator [Deltaproteobacteria bacterium]